MPNYGNKFTCFKCGCKFYDLHKPKAVCPKCGADQAEYKPPLLRATGGKRAHAARREEILDEEESLAIEDLGDFAESAVIGEEEDLAIEGEDAEEELEDE